MTTINHRTVLFRLVRLAGCSRTLIPDAEAATEEKIKILQPTAAQLKICQAAEEKLKALAAQ